MRSKGNTWNPCGTEETRETPPLSALALKLNLVKKACVDWSDQRRDSGRWAFDLSWKKEWPR